MKRRGRGDGKQAGDQSASRKKIQPNKVVIKDKKQRGEWAESVFLVKAGEHGIPVSKPWGDSRSYDFVVGRPRHFKAVQVKCTIAVLESGTGYCCSVCSSHKRYKPGSFDFLAAYIVYENAWYIIPEDKVTASRSISLCTQEGEAKYEEYREAWQLLRSACGLSETIDINACADDGFAEMAQPGGQELVRWVEFSSL